MDRMMAADVSKAQLGIERRLHEAERQREQLRRTMSGVKTRENTASQSFPNLYRRITFALENVTLTRCLVPQAMDPVTELSAGCAVGQALLTARPGEVFTAQAPGGPVQVTVISVA